MNSKHDVGCAFKKEKQQSQEPWVFAVWSGSLNTWYVGRKRWIDCWIILYSKERKNINKQALFRWRRDLLWNGHTCLHLNTDKSWVHLKKEKKEEYLIILFFYRVFSFFPHFLLFSVKIISAWHVEKWWMLILCSRNASLTLNCPKIQCWDYTKHKTETDTRAAKGHESYIVSENTM